GEDHADEPASEAWRGGQRAKRSEVGGQRPVSHAWLVVSDTIGTDVRAGPSGQRKSRPTGPGRDFARGLGLIRRNAAPRRVVTPHRERAPHRSAPASNGAPCPGMITVANDSRSSRLLFRAAGSVASGSFSGPSSLHQAWVHTYTPSAVAATVEMSSAVCPGVRSSRTDGLSRTPSASLSVQRSPSYTAQWSWIRAAGNSAALTV